MEELHRVMSYPKFDFTEEQKERFVNIIMEIATIVGITNKVNIIKDDPDNNVIIESAIVGNVKYVISGDPHLLQLKSFAGVKIVTATEFLME
ncbi:putative toxin-antitoxin system toxin component, PIN family [Candidatus Woesearchaeota archaeon]|nr:putative toxin-antitoxin system toxin component, PIN family [Candidatus Woesearchaeota archaeon]